MSTAARDLAVHPTAPILYASLFYGAKVVTIDTNTNIVTGEVRTGDSHFFGRDAKECADTKAKFPALIEEDPRYMYLQLPTAGNCPENTVAVFRAFNSRPDANHRYSTDRAAIDQVVSLGWIAEGDGPDRVVMCAPA